MSKTSRMRDKTRSLEMPSCSVIDLVEIRLSVLDHQIRGVSEMNAIG